MMDLKKAVYASVALYDSMNMPILRDEFFHALFLSKNNDNDISEADLDAVILSLESEKQIEKLGAYIFLPGKKNLIEEKQQKKNIAQKKWMRAQKYAKFLSIIPTVEALVVCNTLSYDNVNEKSDIDFLIFSQKGKVWTTRFLCTAFSDLFGFRGHVLDPLCLSYFVDASHPELSAYSIEENDIHYKFWMMHFHFVFDPKNIQKTFWAANKEYIQSSFAHANLVNSSYTIQASFLFKIFRYGFQLIPFLFSETFFRNFQKKYYLRKDIQLAEDGKKIVLSDTVIKFHLVDRRKEYNDRFKSLLNTYKE